MRQPRKYRIVLSVQVHENYGAHDWDGEGECPQYWKAKGGAEYTRTVGKIDHVLKLGSEGLQSIVDGMVKGVLNDTDYFRENLICWGLYSDDELSPQETEYCDQLAEGWLTQDQFDYYMAKVREES